MRSAFEPLPYLGVYWFTVESSLRGRGEDGQAREPSQVSSPLYAERYEILGLLGTGNYGTVYRAHDIELQEIVALKVLRKERIGPRGVIERFRSEVRLSRRVTHRNVARMFDIGEFEGEKFLTMEF